MTSGSAREGTTNSEAGSSGWYERVSRELVHDGFNKVYVDEITSPDGGILSREVVASNDVVAVVPVYEDGMVVLIRHYRHPVGTYLLEIPAGKLDVDGEDPADAAQRELAEEVGLRANRLDRLTTIEGSAGMTNERTTIYLGSGLTEVPRPLGYQPQGEEADMEIVRMPLDAAVSAVRDGTISDAKTVVGLLFAEASVRR